MINLKNDYCGIAHKKVLDKLMSYQNETFNSYGLDHVSENAKQIIKKLLKNDNVDIHFIIGGTITNKAVIHHCLQTFEAVICCDTGHINVHETGAIEATGHKVIAVPNVNGKLTPEEIRKAYKLHTDEHMVKPKMVYISNSTETGTVYTKQELQDIHDLCSELDLLFYMDGARLGCALTSNKCDYQFEDLTKLVDVFYIGGAKNGLMLGEAVVIVKEEIKKDFRFMIKHLGAMYSKGFVAGINFEALFEDGLFFDIAKKENEQAQILYNELLKLGVKFDIVPETNQIFPIFKTNDVDKLSKYISFEVWERNGDETTIRFVTNYMTTDEDIYKTIKIVEENIVKQKNINDLIL